MAKYGEIGGSGTQLFNGFITGEEYSPELQGILGLQVYDKMRKGDATVRATLQYIFLPIIRANWFIEPANPDEPKSVEQAEFVEDCLFNRMTITWKEWLRQALLFLPYGRMAFEKVFELRADGKIGWRKFAPRLPHTIEKWETENGKLGITQTLPDGRHVGIPIEKLIILTNEKEGDNWEGISIFRSAYKHWYIKETLYKVDALSIDRQGLGIPVITTPKNATPEDEARAEEIVKNMRANEKAYARLSEGWTLEILNMNAGGNKNAMASIQHHDRQIAKNILAQFMEIGAGQNAGGYSQSQDQSRLYMLSLEAIADYIEGCINNYAIKQLIDLNYGVQEEYPKLQSSKIGQIDFANITTAIQRLAQSQMLTATPATEDHLRDIMDLPEISEAERAELELTKLFDTITKEAQPMQFLPNGAPMKNNPLMGSEEEEMDKKDKSKEKGKNFDKNKEQENENPYMNPERVKAQSELKAFVLDKKIELEAMREAGTDITMEYVAKIKQEIYEMQKHVEDNLPMVANDKRTELIIEMHEKINDTLNQIKGE